MFPDKKLLNDTFDQALSYENFVALGDPMTHQPQWTDRHGRLELTGDQANLVNSFTRRMKVLCLTGTWCGDCALQGAAMQRVHEANREMIDLRFVLRSEEHAELVVKSRINAGFRVPITFFMAEDGDVVSRFGDRTLSRYRAMAGKALSPDAVTILAEAPADPIRAVLQEVLDEFERVHLLLRVSPRLRAVHGD